MAIYYAIVRDGYIQMDERTDQLEIYEEESSAILAKRGIDEVIAVEVKRINAVPPTQKDE